MKTAGVAELKKELKQVVQEAIEEERDFFYQAFLDVIEDVGLSKAIEEGLKTERVGKKEIMGILDAD